MVPLVFAVAEPSPLLSLFFPFWVPLPHGVSKYFDREPVLKCSDGDIRDRGDEHRGEQSCMLPGLYTGGRGVYVDGRSVEERTMISAEDMAMWLLIQDIYI